MEEESKTRGRQAKRKSTTKNTKIKHTPRLPRHRRRQITHALTTTSRSTGCRNGSAHGRAHSRPSAALRLACVERSMDTVVDEVPSHASKEEEVDEEPCGRTTIPLPSASRKLSRSSVCVVGFTTCAATASSSLSRQFRQNGERSSVVVVVVVVVLVVFVVVVVVVVVGGGGGCGGHARENQQHVRTCA
jgi:cobalamin biosynthesis Mg chelatase CobN